jgi:hypothetical protein
MSDKKVKIDVEVAGIDKAEKKVSLFSKSLTKLDNVFKDTAKGLKVFGNSFKALDAAVKATGIGTLVLLIVQLGQKVFDTVKKFAVFEKAIDAVGDVLGGVSAVIERFVELVVDGVLGFVEKFENADVGDLILDAFLTPFQLAADAIVEFVNIGIKALNALGANIEEFEQPFGKLNAVIETTTSIVNELGTAFNTQVNAQQFRRQADEIIKANEGIIASLEETREVEKQLASDTTKSGEERLSAIRRSAEAQREITRLAIKNAELELEAIQRLNAATTSGKEAREAELAALTALNKAKAQAAKQEAELLKQENALREQLFKEELSRLKDKRSIEEAIANERIRQLKRIADDEVRTDEERIAALQEIEDNRSKQLRKNAELAIIEARGNAERIKAIQLKLQNDLLDLEIESNKAIQAIKDERIRIISEAAEKELQVILQAEEKRIARQNEIDKARNKIREEVDTIVTNAILSNLQRVANDTRKSVDEQIAAIKELSVIAIEEAQNRADSQIAVLQEALDEGVISEEQYRDAVIKIRKDLAGEIEQIAIDTANKEDAIRKNSVQKLINDISQVTSAASNLIGNVFGLLSQNISNQIDEIANRLEQVQQENSKLDEQIKNREGRLKQLNADFENTLGGQRKTALAAISAEQEALRELEAQKAAAAEEEKRLLEETRQLKIKQAKQDKANSIIQSIINTALGVGNALSAPFPLNLVLPIIIGASGAVQTATIASQPIPQFATGGFTGEGGKYEPAGIVHKGEYVVPSEIVKNPNYSGVIASLENARLKGYSNGGMVTQDVDKQFDIPPVFVSVQDINDSQNRVNVAKARATL